MKKTVGVFLILLFFLGTVLFCCKEEQVSPFKAIHNKEAHYVGMETCRSCHEPIYQTFIKTGMGQSWGLANRQKSAADFSPSKALIYDTINDLYYRPFWKNDELFIEEFRTDHQDTLFSRKEKVSYIVGSGQHTNSHILNINGYLHQAPITFYTQKGTWDLAPGFEHGKNSRFDRKIETECITCHNAYPDPVAGSMNKYRTVPLGIDCERCHGPGSIHVAAKLKGDRVDTSREKDYTIVNPANLSTSEQNNLCQRCHLQGIAVLNPGKTFFDFQPSDQLKSVMNVFMPAYSGEDKHMIMASHVERMKMSACYLRSEKLSCVTCHNPHISVRSTPRTQFNQSCQSCHKASASCTGSKETRNKNGDDCVQCHMPKNGSIDIPHVAVTDHFIRRNPEASEMKSVVQFIGLRCYNNDHPDARTRARAWMEYFERYDSRPVFLDSCLLELKKTGMPEEDAKDDDVVRYYFLREDFTRLTTMAKTCDASSLKNAWTAYRYGEACVKTRQPAAAIPFLQRACSLMPLVPEYQLKLANAWLDVNNLKEAYRILEPMKTEYPRNADVWFTLGYIAMQNKESGQAIYYNQQCLLLHPDKEQALINLAVLYHQRNQTHLIRPLLYRVLKRNPGHVQVKAMLKELDQ